MTALGSHYAMERTSSKVMGERITIFICFGILCGILAAGLWPFGPPKNAVSWLKEANGLHFNRHGTVLSADALKVEAHREAGPSSCEIWVQPDRAKSSSTLLDVYTPETPFRFSLRQSEADLVLEASASDASPSARTRLIYIDDVFRKDKPLFVTITSSGPHLAVYINGVSVRTSQQFRITQSNFTGQLIIGTSPDDDRGWSGELRLLAIYDQELMPAEVLQHYWTWTTKEPSAAVDYRHTIALYRFTERNGAVVHNQIRPGVDLYIPRQYMLWHQTMLAWPWDAFRPSWSYWEDVLVNIAGFIPLGFFFCAWVSSVRYITRPGLATIIWGGAVSLTIEVLQAYLPTRDSDITDLIMNTLGTAFGVLLYRSTVVRALYSQVLDRIAGVLRSATTP